MYFSPIGFLKSVAKTYYKNELKINLLSREIINVAEKNGRREHVVFSITSSAKPVTPKDAPPTFIAQTKKNNEKQILKRV